MQHGSKKHRRRLRNIRHDSAGFVAAPVAIMLPVLLGMAGLGIDVGMWYASKRDAQSAADAAARAGALELVRNNSASGIVQAAKEDAALNGFDEGHGDTIMINNPPTAGTFAGDGFAVEAVIQHEPGGFFSQFVFHEDATVAARAVARAIALDTCVWALEENGTGLTITGTADVVLDCGIFVNSIDDDALREVGTSCVTASSIRVSGGASGGCLNPEPITGVPPYPDPLSKLEAPSSAGATVFNGKVKVTGGNVTLQPGIYRNGIDISGGATVTFNDGTYELQGGRLKVAGGSSLEGDNVTFYLTDGNGGHAELDITATTIDLSAPDDGAMEGILFFQDRSAPTTKTNKIAGNASVELAGALYFPTTQLDFAGTSSTALPAPMVVAREIRFVGTTDLGGNGSPPPITMVDAQLVE